MSNLRTFHYLVISILLLSSALTSIAQTSTFNYQGRLQDTGTPANGTYDFQFRLFDALVGGNQVGPTLVRDDVAVANGIFTVSLDFGSSAFPGADRFLEIGVRPGVSTGTFTVLSPLQLISSTPYALHSASASAADVATTATNATQLGGVTADQYVVTTDSRLTDARSPTAGSSNYVQNTTTQQASSNFNISGNGTAGGTLQANIVRATSQYRIGNFSDPVLSAPGTNLFVGVGSGIANTAFNNTFVGGNAGRNNTSGPNNAFFGAGAGINNTTAGANSFFGFSAGSSTVGGGSNSFFGYGAGLFNTAGVQNSFFGEAAGGQTTTGSFNSFFGNTTGVSNTVEVFNSLLGSFSDTAPGISNATAIGAQAKVSQSNSLVLGSIAGVNSAGASTNVGIGTTTPTSRLHVVGDTNLVGNLTVTGTLTAQLPTGNANYIQNTTSLQSSSNFNISGDGTAGGLLSGNAINANTQYNLSGNRALGITGGGPFTNSNTFVGFGAGAANTPVTDGNLQGNFNSFFGKQAGLNNTSGFANTFFGSVSGALNTTGPANSFFGYDSGLQNTIGLGNSFFGASAGRANSLGSENSFFGNGTGNSSNGVQNSFFGAMAGVTNETGDSNSALGFAADVGSNNLSNATAIGAQAYVTASNSLVLGSISGINAAAVDTNVGIGTTAPIARLHISGNASLANLLELENTNPGNARAFLVGPTANYFVIYDVNAATARLAINYGGNVGLGTTAPGAPLEVRRNAAIGADWQTGQLRISGASDPNMQLSVGYDTVNNLGVIQAGQANVAFRTLSFNPSGGNVGVGTTSPDQKLSVNGNASKSGGGSWLSFSDERLKNITGRFTPGLKALMQLQPLRYEYRRDNALKLTSDGEHVGFSAQAVQKVIPEAVTRDERGYLLVNNDPIIWTMLNAIKEQQKQIQQQQQQIDRLKQMVCRAHRRTPACK